jgi:precorrin-6B methylase 2
MVYNPRATLKGKIGYWAKDSLPPFLATPLARARSRWNGTSANRDALVREFALPWRVVNGPFRGMNYLAESTGSSLTPKLLGTYELELHGVIEKELIAQPKLVIDVGAAEGYYAVGFAWRCPQARVILFDTFGYARVLARKLAKINQVSERVTVRSRCDPAALAAALQGQPDALVISDCEGYEMTLLDLAAAPALAGARILVETHDFLVEDATAILIQRFQNTHAITRIDAVPRTIEHFPKEVNGPDSRKVEAMNERRPPGMSWLYMTPLG